MKIFDNIDYRFKLLYAIGIIMVVGGHCGGGGFDLLNNWFPYYGFHLALFAFGSGYFYKKSAEENILKYAVKKLRTLIIPVYIYNVAYCIIVQVSKSYGFEIGGDPSFYNLVISPITNGHQFNYNLGGWFVIPLFMVEMYNVIIRKGIRLIFGKDVSEYILWGISIALGLAGNQLACMGYLYRWCLVLIRMLYFIPFYELGIVFNKKLEVYDKKIPSFYYIAALFIIQFAIALYYGHMPVYSAAWCNDFTEGPVMPIIVGYIGIALWMRIAIIMEPVLGRSKYIVLIADNTFSIMLNHFLGFMLIKTIFATLNKITGAFSDFNWISYRTDIWYYYMPGGLLNSLIIYSLAGIVFPILLQKALDKVRLSVTKMISWKKH